MNAPDAFQELKSRQLLHVKRKQNFYQIWKTLEVMQLGKD